MNIPISNDGNIINNNGLGITTGTTTTAGNNVQNNVPINTNKPNSSVEELMKKYGLPKEDAENILMIYPNIFSMKPEEQQAIVVKYQTAQTKGDLDQTVEKEIDVNQTNQTETAENKENFHKFQVDLTSAEYQAMNEKEKSQYIVDEFGKFLYGNDEKWGKLELKEKIEFLSEKFGEKLKKDSPETYEKLSKYNNFDIYKFISSKLNSLEVALDNANGETDFNKIWKNYEELSPNEKMKASYEYVKKLNSKGIKLSPTQHDILLRGDYYKGLHEYLEEKGVHGKKASPENEFEYLQSKVDKNGIDSLNHIEKEQYDALDYVRQSCDNHLIKQESGERISLEEIIETDSSIELVRDKLGRVNYKSDTNKHLINDYICENLNSFSTQEEKDKWFLENFSNLSTADRLKFYKIINDRHNKKLSNDQKAHYLNLLLQHGDGSAVQDFAAAFRQDETFDPEFGKLIANILSEKITEAKESGNLELADDLGHIYHALCRKDGDDDYNSDIATDAVDTNIKSAIEAALKIADIKEAVGKAVADKVNKSTKATSETKEFYSQGYISLGKDDASKLKRNELMVAYNNVDFMKGAVKAYASYDSEESVKKADEVVTAAVENLDKEGRVLVTQARMDVMPEFSADLQKNMFERTMQSKHDDVLEIGAENIYKLDESIKDYAVDLTKSLGKSNVTNSIQTEIPKGIKSSAAVQKSVSETFGKITSNDSKVTSFVEEAVNVDWNSTEGAQKFVELADRHPYEFSKILNKLSNTDKEKVIDKFCQNASAQQILKLIQNNPSLYAEILKSSGSKLNIFADQIFKILISNGEDMVKIAKDLNINLVEFANANKEYAAKVAIKIENSFFAREILKDPVFYGILPGSKDHNDLCRLVSQKNIEKASQEPPISSESGEKIVPPKFMVKS